MASGFLDGQRLGRNIIRIQVIRKFGVEIYGQSSLNRQKSEDTCVPCEYSLKGDLSKRQCDLKVWDGYKY
jgi:hypothetical protein